MNTSGEVVPFRSAAVAAMSAPAGRQLSVLLVEDNWLDARLIFGLLKDPIGGQACRHASSLAKARKLLSGAQFDVILLDLNLEDSSGPETFSAVHEAAGSAAILVLSGSDDEELAISTVRAGAQDYLVKGSFDGRLLFRAIRYAWERKRTEEALRHSEDTVRAIFENSLDGIVISGADGACVEANSAAAQLFGLGREQLIGRTIGEFCADEYHGDWAQLSNSRHGRKQFWMVRGDGTRRLVDCSFTTDILPGRHLSVLRDITEQQSLEEQLRQSQKMEAVGRLAGGVAHDFNNILGIISGYTELLQLSLADKAHANKLEKILAATQKAASLTKQLLAFGRKQVLSPRVLDVAAVQAELRAMIQCLVGAEIRLVTHVEKELGMVRADQGQLEQVILNMVANARDAMPEGGTLSIRIENYCSTGGSGEAPEGNYVLLSVSDTGCGMDPETQERIFEPFFTTKRNGSGLGLATAYGIVKQSGGHIQVESAPGEGSTFNVYLPVVSARSGAGQKTKSPAQTASRGTILFVDDEDELRDAATEYLESRGYLVMKARNGKEAAEISDSYKGEILVVISDIVMPEVNGRGLVDHIRATRPDARILVISGYADDAVIRHGIFLETTCFLQKPFTFQALDAKISSLLDRSVATFS